VRAERQEPHRLLPTVAAQDLAHRFGAWIPSEKVLVALRVHMILAYGGGVPRRCRSGGTIVE
jgi:hypothetical protein